VIVVAPGEHFSALSCICYSVSLLKQQSTERHVVHCDTLS